MAELTYEQRKSRVKAWLFGLLARIEEEEIESSGISENIGKGEVRLTIKFKIWKVGEKT